MDYLCIRTGKRSVPANTTYRTRTTAHQPLNLVHAGDEEDWRRLACFSRCTAPELFSPRADRLCGFMHDTRTSRLATY